MTTAHNKDDDKAWKSINAKAPKHYHAFVDKLVSAGTFQSKAHVVRAALDKLDEHIRSNEPTARIGELGLVDMIYPANDQDSTSLIESADELTLVFNDMRLWLPGPEDKGLHLVALRKRLVDKKLTRIFFDSPKNPTDERAFVC